MYPSSLPTLLLIPRLDNCLVSTWSTLRMISKFERHLYFTFHFKLVKSVMMRVWGWWCWLCYSWTMQRTVTCTRSGKDNTKQGRPTSKTPAGMRSRCPWMLIDWELQVLCVAPCGSGWLRHSHRQQPPSLTTYIWLILVHRAELSRVTLLSPSLPLSLSLSLSLSLGGRLNTNLIFPKS